MVFVLRRVQVREGGEGAAQASGEGGAGATEGGSRGQGGRRSLFVPCTAFVVYAPLPLGDVSTVCA